MADGNIAAMNHPCRTDKTTPPPNRPRSGQGSDHRPEIVSSRAVDTPPRSRNVLEGCPTRRTARNGRARDTVSVDTATTRDRHELISPPDPACQIERLTLLLQSSAPSIITTMHSQCVDFPPARILRMYGSHPSASDGGSRREIWTSRAVGHTS